MEFITKLSFIVLIPLLVIPGCAQYQPKNLKHLTSETAHFDETKENITLRVKVLSKAESNAIFSGRGHYLFSNKPPYYPVQITLFNKTNHTIVLSPDHIDLKLVTAQKVIKALQYNVAARTIIPAAVGIIGVAASLASAGDSCYSRHRATDSAVIVGSTAGVTSIVGNTTAQEANTQLEDDITQKILNEDGIVIKPYEKNSVLVFVEKRNLSSHFTIKIERDDAQKIIFEASI